MCNSIHLKKKYIYILQDHLYFYYSVNNLFLFNDIIFYWLIYRDILLLETGFLCILLAPFWYPQRGKPSTPSDAVTFWAVRWLFFRFIFSSGVVKLTSGCPTWWKLDGNLQKYTHSDS